jgi:hypothetical protein
MASAKLFGELILAYTITAPCQKTPERHGLQQPTITPWKNDLRSWLNQERNYHASSP